MTVAATPMPPTKSASVLPLLGNLLEWYDFAIYGYLAQPLGDAFFPAESNSAALLSSFAVFAVGFLMRPIGSNQGVDTNPAQPLRQSDPADTAGG